MSILSIILQAIGGQKLKQVASVFAEGKNITHQLGGGIGLNSLFNKIPSLNNILNQSGIGGVLTNPLGSLISSVGSKISNATSIVSSLTHTVITQQATRFGTSSQTTVASYPLFSAALTTSQTIINNYSRMTELLTGRVIPDSSVNEYGISDVLSLTSNGVSSLDALNAPLNIQTQLQNLQTQIDLLVVQAQAGTITDSNAVVALNILMTPVTNSINISQSAYFTANANVEQQAQLSDILSYIGSIENTNESAFVTSLVSSTSLANQILIQNQLYEIPVTE